MQQSIAELLTLEPALTAVLAGQYCPQCGTAIRVYRDTYIHTTCVYDPINQCWREVPQYWIIVACLNETHGQSIVVAGDDVSAHIATAQQLARQLTITSGD